ncbi:hypothetical protein AB0E12_17275 [Micromonospora chersina]|uniref:hypothetical protein n=1 Tax=Micromonospora chersina TaxID=47854 RepID=UPI0033CB4ACF
MTEDEATHALAVALAQLCADHGGQFRRPRPLFLHEVRCRLPHGHPLKYDADACEVACLEVRWYLAEEFRVQFQRSTAPSGLPRLCVRLIRNFVPRTA